MTVNGWMQIACFALAVLLVTKPLGLYLLAVYEGRMRWLAPVERLLYRAAGIDPAAEQQRCSPIGSC
jgi:K+-transporting ATPase ATPase A chain